jgi:hypothetical protein
VIAAWRLRLEVPVDAERVHAVQVDRAHPRVGALERVQVVELGGGGDTVGEQDRCPVAGSNDPASSSGSVRTARPTMTSPTSGLSVGAPGAEHHDLAPLGVQLAGRRPSVSRTDEARPSAAAK